MVHVKVFAPFACEYARLWLQEGFSNDYQVVIRAGYRAFLGREPDQQGFENSLHSFKVDGMTRREFLKSLIHSTEYHNRFTLPFPPIHALHLGRIKLMQESIPPAQVILDIGGAAQNLPQGALLGMGYPYKPRLVCIVDLPPPDRIHFASGAETTQEFVTNEGVPVYYFYRSMTDTSFIRSESIELIVSGESIEHVTEEEAQVVCREAYRVLKPGGHFCLDTPNATLMRLLSPDELTHPDHKKEYYVHELRTMLEQAGFTIVAAKGVCPMPNSLQRGSIDYRELVQNIYISDDPEEGYVFFLHARKPPVS